MDCGPAALKCLLEGFGIHASYGRLREICQTSVDGTSIDSLEEIAGELGLDAEQVMIPADHLAHSLRDLLPGILVVRGVQEMIHFVVGWKERWGTVRIMDPAVGRRVRSVQGIERELVTHAQGVSAEAWRRWASSQEGTRLCLSRLRRIGHPDPRGVVREAALDPDWRHLAALDATLRMVDLLVDSKSLKAGPMATAVFQSLYPLAKDEAGAATLEAVPDIYWTVRPHPSEDPSEPQVLFRGALLLRVAGRRRVEAPSASSSARSWEIASILGEAPRAPARHLLQRLGETGWLNLSWMMLAGLVATAAAFLQLTVLRVLAVLGPELQGPERREWAGMLVGLTALAFSLEAPAVALAQRLGRHVENTLRIKLFLKIPNIAEAYFGSRTASDMAGRVHALFRAREFPPLAQRLARVLFTLVFAVAALALLAPGFALQAAGVAVLAVAVPLLTQPWLVERELRVREHVGGLERIHLEALLGTMPLRTHDAGSVIRQIHENALSRWARSSRAFIDASVISEAWLGILPMAAAFAAAVSLLAGAWTGASALLAVYWLLSLPSMGQELAFLLRQYPPQRNVVLRALEPLSAPEEAAAPALAGGEDRCQPVGIQLNGVQVLAAGHAILEDVTLDIPAGAHVAVVGSSGAGKSSLLRLVLGLHRPATGAVLAGGEPLEGARIEWLRRRAAWVDPAAALWNRTLGENLHFGTPEGLSPPSQALLEQAELMQVLQKLPQGLQEPLADQGTRLSGGEAQRLRLARGMARPWASLVLLDEAFRGLERHVRHELLARARQLWRSSTLLCVTHDLEATLTFDRVVVVENARVVEQGVPQALMNQPGSRYAAMVAEATRADRTVWSSSGWRRLRLEDGVLRPEKGAS